jgi:Abnormal spindle-like microcephaly-assoc'd, ASPM-SPD-2-Hydin
MTGRRLEWAGLILILAGSVGAQTFPAFTLSYSLASNQNVVALQAGGMISFPPTLVGATATATLFIANTGTGPGMVTGISGSGSAFQLQGIPLLPVTIAAGATLPISVIYSPTAISTDSGAINLSFNSGAPVTINLSGSGTEAVFSYQILSTPPTSVAAGGTILLADTAVGQTSSLSIRVQNSGNASGTVTTINATGPGFSVSNSTPLPTTLAAGASLTFNVNFSPTQPGAATGTLIVNSAVFNLTGFGLGSLLSFSYVTGGTTVTLGGTTTSVIFSPIAVTQSEQIVLDVKNTGTLSATIANIGVNQAGGPFTLSGLPALPVTLAPSSDFHITIQFAPTSLGFSNGTLMLDSTSIGLVGSGTQPPALPSYTLSGPSGTGTPMSQPSIGLTLASAYPVAITGTLTMSISGNLPADPAVQFATGGRTVTFVIPANQTSAVFASSGNQIGIQTGTVAGTVTLTPTFATQAGSISLTPATPQTLQFTIAPAAPTLVAMQISDISQIGFTIEVTGFSTTRTATSLTIAFTPAAGYSMPTSSFTVDLSQASTLWFQSTGSQTFGGQFTLSIPFTLQGLPNSSSSATTPVVLPFSAVSATIANSTGTSNAIQANLQ